MRNLGFASAVLYEVDADGLSKSTKEIVAGNTYNVFFGYFSDEPVGADIELYVKSGTMLNAVVAHRFEASDAISALEFSRYSTSVSFTAEDSYEAGSFTIEALALTDDGRTLSSASRGVATTDTIKAGANGLLAVDIEPVGPESNIDVVITSVLGGDPIVISGLNIDPNQEGYVTLPLSSLGTQLAPGSYDVSFRQTNSAAGPVGDDDDDDTGSGTASAIQLLTTSLSILPADILSRPLASGDFGGDRIEDVLLFNSETGFAGQYGMPTAEWSSFGRAGDNWEAVGRGLFDSDDQAADVLWHNTETGNLGRFDIDANGRTWVNMGKADVAWSYAGSADFNGDGTDDILWVNEETGNLGQFRIVDGLPSWTGAGLLVDGWSFKGLGDFNGDGMADVLIMNAETGQIGQFQTTADGQTWATIAVAGEGWDVATTGDLNGDGTTDIMVFNEDTRGIGYYDMADGDASWVGLDVLEAGWTIEGTSDFDGDGSDDVALHHEDGRIARLVVDGEMSAIVMVGTAGADWDIIL